MQVEETTEKQKSDLTKKLLNVDFNHITVPIAKDYPQWESLFRFTQQRVTRELGSEFNLSADLSEFSRYMYASFSFDLVSCILLFNMAGFISDDHLDKFPGDYEKVIQQLRSRDCQGNAIYEKWFRLVMKVCKEVMDETLSEQLFDRCIAWLTKAVEMKKLCTGQSTFSDKDFMELRCVDSGASLQFFCVAIGAGLPYTDELKNDPNYLGLNEQAALHVALINDLYSLRKEIRDDVYKCNYVYVKMKNNCISAQAAVGEIILEIYESERLARVFGERLKEMNEPTLSRYADGIYDVMAGNHYWSAVSLQPNLVCNLTV